MIFSIDYQNQLITYTQKNDNNATHIRFFGYNWETDRRKLEIIFSNLESIDIINIPDNFIKLVTGAQFTGTSSSSIYPVF